MDEALFGLGEHRYEALINLLIQLRQPQLSKRPDEKLLSRALTEALPPLSPGLVTTVAEAFRGLDEERDALRALAEARTAATDFLRHYRRYAQVAAKRKATGPRQAQSRYEQLGRDLATAEEAFAAADSQLQAARRELAELEQRRTRLEARREALAAGPGDAGRRAAGADAATRRDAGTRRRASGSGTVTGWPPRCGPVAVRASEAAQRAGRGAAKRWTPRKIRPQEAAAAARCAPGHRAAADGWEQDLPRARRETQAVADRQARAVGQLERLLAEAGERRQGAEAARAEEDRLTAEIQAAASGSPRPSRRPPGEPRELAGAYRSYLAGLTELRVAIRTS